MSRGTQKGEPLTANTSKVYSHGGDKFVASRFSMDRFGGLVTELKEGEQIAVRATFSSSQTDSRISTNGVRQAFYEAYSTCMEDLKGPSWNSE